jgi:hypothetical protein
MRCNFKQERRFAMCHGYETRWWRSENTATKSAKQANVGVIRTEKAEPVAEKKIDEKELIPAE